jgi:hypothetical protein
MPSFDPIQDSRPARPQQRQVVCKERQANWKHPESKDRQESQNAPKRQQYAYWNPEPAAAWHAKETNG